MLATDAQVQIALIAACGAFASSALSAIVGFVNNELARRALRHAAETKADVVEIKHQTDGMTSRLEALAGEKGVLEGKAQGLVEGHAQGVADATGKTAL